jgi:translation initiation factor 5B
MSKSNKNAKKPLNPMAKFALQQLKLVEEENNRIKAIQEEAERKIREEEEKEKARLKAIEEETERKRKAKQDKKQAQKDAGTYKTKSEKEKENKNKHKLEQLQKNSNKIIINNDNNAVINKIDPVINKKTIINEIVDYGYRSPIMCIMGHVDTGKTKLLDNIRNTHVQDGEAGGITQQIGASFIPLNTLVNRSHMTRNDIKIPGLLMIDTPGHEAFANLRYRGSSLCDIAIVVIDITGGLEQQTIQSINILVEAKIKFVFALNKIDRMYGWSSIENRDIKSALNENTISESEFKNKLESITTKIMCLGLNAKLFWENDSPNDTISICPISAKTGEGICDLLKLVTNICQNDISEEITFKEELKCIVMEKTIDLNSIDVILINGTLKKGDKISIQTNDGIINTTIKNLLTPPPNRESRVKTEYVQHESVKGSMGVKIVANNIDKAIVGTQIQFGELDEIILPEITKMKLQDEGVILFASTQGALEALVQYLQNECKPSVPISNVFIGPVTKKHIVKLSINKSDKKEYSTILAFNVNIDDEAQEIATKNDIKIFSAEIIYHLFNFYTKHRQDMIDIRKAFYRPQLVFPCTLKILEKHVYNKKNPLIFGVSVLDGNLHIGTPITTSDTKTYIGKVISIQLNSNEVLIGKKGTDVCIKVENDQNPNIMYGRQFDHKNPLCSEITRTSIDIMKNHFKDEATQDDAKLIVKLKSLLSII